MEGRTVRRLTCVAIVMKETSASKHTHDTKKISMGLANPKRTKRAGNADKCHPASTHIQ